MAILVACLAQLRTEFDQLAPGRSKASDGWIGDAAHAASSSDHNDDESGTVPIHDADSTHEVHALDVTAAGPWPDGLTMEKIVQFVLVRCRSGAENRLRYLIFNKRIWSASSGWVQKTYAGASPHTEHAHFSASYETAKEASAASWHLEDLVALTADEIKRIATAVWTLKISSPSLGLPDRAAADWLKDAEQASRELATLGKSLTAAVAALAAKDAVDEQALGAAIAPGLAAALVPLLAGALPDGAEVTEEQLAAGFVRALREMAAG